MFSGSNSNLQYLDTGPSSDWSDCFLLPPFDWISVGLLTWSFPWPPFDWISVESVIWLPWTYGLTRFCAGMLVFLRKSRETLFIGIIESVSALHPRLQWERFIVILNLRFQENTFDNKTFQLTNLIKRES